MKFNNKSGRKVSCLIRIKKTWPQSKYKDQTKPNQIEKKENEEN